MVSMVAVLLANADGRGGQYLSDLMALRPDKARVMLLYGGAFSLNAIVSAISGTLADQMIGQGVLLLLLAFSLVSASASLIWQRHWGVGGEVSAERLAAMHPIQLGLRMILSQFGDRNQFLIGAFAATTGAGLWAAAGGAAGWALAFVPVMATGGALTRHRAARWLRWAAAGVLMMWGAWALRTAFGV